MGLLFLVGPRGCGKTLAATLLKRDYGWRGYDTDVLIRRKACKTVAAIVAEGGWPAFRKLEKESLAEVIERLRAEDAGDAVIATGGGVILDPENRERMRAAGVVAYLAASPAVLAGRLGTPGRDLSRPALTDLPPEQEIAAVLREREPLYRAAAHYVLDACQSPDAVARAAHACLAGYSRNAGAAL